MYLFTHVNAESVKQPFNKSRGRVKRITFTLCKPRRQTQERIVSCLSSSLLAPLTAPCVINSKLRMRIGEYSLQSHNPDPLLRLCGRGLCERTVASLHKVYTI